MILTCLHLFFHPLSLSTFPQMLAQAEAAGEAAALVFLRAAPSSVPPDHSHEAPADGGMVASRKKSRKASASASGSNSSSSTKSMRKLFNSSKRDALYHTNASSWLSSGVGYRYGSPPFFDKRVARALVADDKGLGHAEQVGKVIYRCIYIRAYISIAKLKILKTSLCALCCICALVRRFSSHLHKTCALLLSYM